MNLVFDPFHLSGICAGLVRHFHPGQTKIKDTLHEKLRRNTPLLTVVE